MNGKKAKAIRRKVYGDASLKNKRYYDGGIISTFVGAITGRTLRNETGTLRHKYQEAKKAYKAGA